MSNPPVMSTPIANIPIQPTSASSTEEDPEVLAILQEMQQQQAMGTQQVPVIKQMNLPYQPPMQPTMVPATPNYGVYVKPGVSKPLFQGETAQRAVYAALIAYVLFYPKTLEIIYGRFPMFEKAMPYDSIIRFLLLAVVLYILMWKFDM